MLNTNSKIKLGLLALSTIALPAELLAMSDPGTTSTFIEAKTEYRQDGSPLYIGHGEWFECTAGSPTAEYNTQFKMETELDYYGSRIDFTVYPNRFREIGYWGDCDTTYDYRTFEATFNLSRKVNGSWVLEQQWSDQWQGRDMWDSSRYTTPYGSILHGEEYKMDMSVSVAGFTKNQTSELVFGEYNEPTVPVINILSQSTQFVDPRYYTIGDMRKFGGHGQWFACADGGNSNNYTHYDMSAEINAEFGDFEIYIGPNNYMVPSSWGGCLSQETSRQFYADATLYKLQSGNWVPEVQWSESWVAKNSIDRVRYSSERNIFELGSQYKLTFNVSTEGVTKNQTIIFKYE